MPTRFEKLLSRLTGFGVEFVLVGGVAASIHGSSRATFDLDVVYARNDENLTRITDALAQLEAALQDAKPVQFKQNIALVLKYFDKLASIMQEQDLKLRPAD